MMMSLDLALGISVGSWVLLGLYVFSEVGRTYAGDGIFTTRLLALWFVMWGFYHLAVILSSLSGSWPLPLTRPVALAAGGVLIAIGLVVLAAGMIEFRSLRRSCGQDISRLITSGIYRWSRNPQFIGCLLYLLGISLAGRSGLAFLLTGAATLVIRLYTTRLAEPYLGRIYGEEYRLYKSRTGRWVSIPK
ncbi:MAG: isoprenylcysteine carboxylmethyltransferase family protein [Planctomycetota bacterium]